MRSKTHSLTIIHRIYTEAGCKPIISCYFRRTEPSCLAPILHSSWKNCTGEMLQLIPSNNEMPARLRQCNWKVLSVPPFHEFQPGIKIRWSYLYQEFIRIRTVCRQDVTSGHRIWRCYKKSRASTSADTWPAFSLISPRDPSFQDQTIPLSDIPC